MLTKIVTRLQIRPLGTRTFATGNSIFKNMEMAPADPILGLNVAFKQDTHPNKQLLGMGAYRDDAGKPFILDCVKKAQEKIVRDNMDHEYAFIDGIPSYNQNCIELAYGKDSEPVKSKRIAPCQAISGTGSLRVGFDFLKLWHPNKKAKVWMPDPTWPTHHGIANKSGYETGKYRYFNIKTKAIDI